ncbi:hypothetical protein HAX54_033135 [Datura stramonium]|uniref:Uncharacterized protein n=1 Tax=Datura stramonium TaxID=4076 RepID=A0ABS8VCW2_DATST|nr:hypothetical protein [Datura stramonium]
MTSVSPLSHENSPDDVEISLRRRKSGRLASSNCIIIDDFKLLGRESLAKLDRGLLATKVSSFVSSSSSMRITSIIGSRGGGDGGTPDTTTIPEELVLSFFLFLRGVLANKEEIFDEMTVA